MADTRCWLFKSEPDTYGITDLERDGRTPWDGIRNYQARNLMRDEMRVGDEILFYHSRTGPIGVAGRARVASAPYPDPTQFVEGSKYHDPKSTPDAPRWVLVDIAFVERFPRVVSLAEIKADPALDGIPVAKKGQRLSIQPVEPAHFAHVVALARQAP